MSRRTVDALKLPRWVDPKAAGAAGGSGAPAAEPHVLWEKVDGSPFPFDAKINSKLALWQGDLCSLEIEAMVNTTNESLRDRSGVAGRIHARAGPQLAAECAASEGCHTGDAVVTRAYRLPARSVIHAVGPRFSVKYKTAAENALHSCYRRVLERCVESKLRTVATCVINTESKGYPKEQAAHVAARTIRRFLEKHGKHFDLVVFAVDNDTDMAIYSAVMPLYFPRSADEEARAVKELPKNVGNAMGGTVSRERAVRIAAGPLGSGPRTLEEVKYVKARIGPSTSKVSNDRNSSGDGGEDDEPTPAPVLIDPKFTTRQASPDEKRSKLDPKVARARRQVEERYAKFLERSKRADLKDLERFKFIYTSGKDKKGRPIIVFVASHLPASNVDMDRVLLYIISVMDPVVSEPYNLVYLHTNIADGNKPSYAWMRKTYNALSRKYKKNLKALYVVHPSWWVRMLFMFARPFVSSKFFKKLYYIDYLMDVYEIFDPKTLRIPQHVVRYDQVTNVSYYNERYRTRRAKEQQ